MIRVIIVDDEQHCRDHLLHIINENDKEIEIVAIGTCVKEGIQLIEEKKPDLVFLDVEMPDNTGFELLQKIGNISFEIIFTTAFDKYAVRAIKASAIDFLLKPINRNDFGEAMARYHQKKSMVKSNDQFQILFENIKYLHDPLKKILLPTQTGYEFVNIKDIIRLEGDSNYTNIFFADKKKILVPKTLKDFEELLGGHQFFRIHQSHLINMRYIKKYVKGAGGIVCMEDGSELDVSRRRKDEFIKAMQNV